MMLKPSTARIPACRHLDADEAVVLGAALYAANLSTTFRLRKCGMTDGVTHPVTYQVDAAEDSCVLKLTVPSAWIVLSTPAPGEPYSLKCHKPHAAQFGQSAPLQCACVRQCNRTNVC